jgi:hypothetical protein
MVSGDAPMTAQMPVVRAESVAAPASGTTTQRPRTQWTGNLAVPQVEAPVAPKPSSKLPIIVGVVIVVGGGGVAAFLATRHKDGPEPGSASGSNAGWGNASGGSQVALAPVDAAPAAVAIDAAPATPPVPLPEWSMIHLDSNPHNADVYELKDNGKEVVLGKTPMNFKLKGSTVARQFSIRLKGYSNALVELTPATAKVDDTETLEKGAATATVIHKVGGTGGSNSGSNTGSAGPGSGGVITHPEPVIVDAGVEMTVKPDAAPVVVPKPDAAVKTDECPDPDMPCLKQMPGHP